MTARASSDDDGGDVGDDDDDDENVLARRPLFCGWTCANHRLPRRRGRLGKTADLEETKKKNIFWPVRKLTLSVVWVQHAFAR